MAKRTGGYYWLPAPSPGNGSPSWSVMTRRQLGFDAETGHVEMWDAVVDRLAALWRKDATALRRTLGNCSYGLPRGRVTRPEKRFLVLHGDDWPRADGLERVLLAFGLDPRAAKVIFDEHERTMREDRITLGGALEIPAF